MQEHIYDKIESYADGTLDTANRRGFEAHLSDCSKCSGQWQNFQSTQSLLGHLQLAEAPPVPGPDFYFKVRRSIAEQSDSEWFSMLPSIIRNPRFAYPLFFVFFGLLLTAFSMDYTGDLPESGIFGVPPSLTSRVSSLSANGQDRRDSVMVSLVQLEEGED